MHFLGQHRLLLRNYQKLVLKTTFMAEVFQISSIFHIWNIFMPLNHMPLVIKSKKKLIHIYLWIRVHEKGTAKQKEMLEAKVEDGLSNLHQLLTSLSSMRMIDMSNLSPACKCTHQLGRRITRSEAKAWFTTVAFVLSQVRYLSTLDKRMSSYSTIWLSSNFLAGGPVFLMQNIVDKLP